MQYSVRTEVSFHKKHNSNRDGRTGRNKFTDDEIVIYYYYLIFFNVFRHARKKKRHKSYTEKRTFSDGNVGIPVFDAKCIFFFFLTLKNFDPVTFVHFKRNISTLKCSIRFLNVIFTS